MKVLTTYAEDYDGNDEGIVPVESVEILGGVPIHSETAG